MSMNLSNPVRSGSLAAAVVLVTGVGSADGAFVTLGGGSFSGVFGAPGPMAINSLETLHISATVGDATMEGDVESTNVNGTNLILTLTNFTFTSTRAATITLTIDII